MAKNRELNISISQMKESENTQETTKEQEPKKKEDETRGRPSFDAELKRNKTILLSLTKGERELIDKAFNLYNEIRGGVACNMGQFARQFFLEKVKEYLKDNDK